MKTLFVFLFYSINMERRGLISLSGLYPISFNKTSIGHPFKLKRVGCSLFVSSNQLSVSQYYLDYTVKN